MISTVKIWHVVTAVAAALAFAAAPLVIHAQTVEVPAAEETAVASDVNKTATVSALGDAAKMEIQRQSDELRNELRRQYLDDRAEYLTQWARTINWWLAGVAILFTALGIILTFSFRHKAREAIKKAQESADKANAAADKAEKARDKAVKDSEEIEGKKHKIEEMMSTFPEGVGNYTASPTNIGQLEKATEEDLEKKIFSFSEAIHRDPKSADYNIRGFLKAKIGRHQDAIEDYNESIRLNPKLSQAYHFRGVSKADLGRYHAAIEDYDEAIRLDEKHIFAHLYRGLANMGLGRIKKTLSDFQIALNLTKESGNEEGITTISDAIQELKDDEQNKQN